MASELFSGWDKNPSVYSPYLPKTTPRGVAYVHKSEEIDTVYRFNPLGYRGERPLTLKPSPGTERVLFCGDSFTLGWANDEEDAFVYRVAAQLGAGVEVLNGAYHGYSPGAYYAYLQEEGLALAPRLVVIVLYSGNDMEELRANRYLKPIVI